MVAGVDRFGNPIDPEVGYARGRILASSEDEALRRERGMALIRARYKAFGREGLYDLTGLSGGFPVEPEHLGAYRFPNPFGPIHHSALPYPRHPGKYIKLLRVEV